jgi:hypothetical protein
MLAMLEIQNCFKCSARIVYLLPFSLFPQLLTELGFFFLFRKEILEVRLICSIKSSDPESEDSLIRLGKNWLCIPLILWLVLFYLIYFILVKGFLLTQLEFRVFELVGMRFCFV